MIMTTTDTIPQPFTILGVVMSGGSSLTPTRALFSAGRSAADHARNAMRELEKEAVRMGADAVIGIRYSSVYTNTTVMMGTAIRFVREEVAV